MKKSLAVLLSLLLLAVFAIPSCQNDPVDEFASESIYSDNYYDLAGNPWGGGAANFTDLGDTPANYVGHALEYVQVNGAANALVFNAVAGGGDVSAAANLADNAIIRGDGGVKGVQDSALDITDGGDLDMNTGNITDVGNVDGRDVSVDGGKLDGIEVGADVTDNANVTAAGAAMAGGAFHDGFSDFVGNEHIDHTTVTLTAGTGLTGGGDISANRTFNTDVGIADDKILQVDDADAADNDYAKFTVNGLEGRSYTEVLSDLSGQAGSAFDFNDKNITQVGTIEALGIWDDDTDTGIQVEEAADEDKIRMDIAGVESFYISDAGIVTMAQQPAANAYRHGAPDLQTIPNTQWIILQFDQEGYDIQNDFDSSVTAGAADATQAFKLHDADGGFTADMVGASIWNTTDNTYTTVAAYVDSGELTLTADIMVNGESYEIYWARFTAPEDGKYMISTSVIYVTLPDQTRAIVDILVNGSGICRVFDGAASGASYHGGAGATIADLSANDYVQVRTYQASGVNQSVLGYANTCQITVAKIL